MFIITDFFYLTDLVLLQILLITTIGIIEHTRNWVEGGVGGGRVL